MKFKLFVIICLLSSACTFRPAKYIARKQKANRYTEKDKRFYTRGMLVYVGVTTTIKEK